MFTTRWTPVLPGAFQSIRRELEDAFAHTENGSSRQHAPAQLPLTIWEDDQQIYLEADVPGFSSDSLELRFQDGQLVISGERKVSNDGGRYWHNERMFGQFHRVVSLPDVVDPDQLEAELENGILYVTMAKKPEARPKKISVQCRSGKTKRISQQKT